MIAAPASGNMTNPVQAFADEFTYWMKQVLTTIDSTVMDIARLAYVTVLLVGLLLYYTHAERRLGKDLIKGGVILAILSEFIFPVISKL